MFSTRGTLTGRLFGYVNTTKEDLVVTIKLRAWKELYVVTFPSTEGSCTLRKLPTLTITPIGEGADAGAIFYELHQLYSAEQARYLLEDNELIYAEVTDVVLTPAQRTLVEGCVLVRLLSVPPHAQLRIESTMDRPLTGVTGL